MNNKNIVKQLFYKILSQKDDFESFKFYIDKFCNSNLQSFYKKQKYIHYLSMFQNVIDCKEVMTKINNKMMKLQQYQIINRTQFEWNELMFLSKKTRENINVSIENLPPYNNSERIKRLFLFLQKKNDFDFDLKNEVFIVNVETFRFLNNFQI